MAAMRLLPAALALLAAPTLALAQHRAPEARYAAPLSLGARIGYLAATSAAGNGTPSAVGGGAYGLFDLRNVLADVTLDAYGGSGTALVAAGMGVYWAVRPDNVTPYVGGGARLGYTRFGGNGATGLLLHGAVGLLASRQWSPQVRVELAWFASVMGERPKGGGPAHYASGPLATIGLGF
jgi:hypothetical protein